jgi:hypothetical protein
MPAAGERGCGAGGVRDLIAEDATLSQSGFPVEAGARSFTYQEQSHLRAVQHAPARSKRRAGAVEASQGGDLLNSGSLNGSGSSWAVHRSLELRAADGQ